MTDQKTDIVLINPPWAVLDDRAILQNSLPPLGILSIAAHLESLGHGAQVYDIHGEKRDEDNLRAMLRAHKPRFVGLSVLTNMCNPAHKIAHICKEELPGCLVVAGGCHAEALPERMLRNSAIDAVVRGDGEDTMAEIMSGRPFPDIRGLSFRKGDAVVHTSPREVEMDLDRYPMPAYHLVDFDYYFPAAGSYRNLPAINMLMTRGCPGKCNFCNSAMTTLRARSPESVVAQIKHLHKTYGIRQVQFYDDTFTAMKAVCLRFCELLAEAKLDLTWVAYIRGDCLSDRVASALKKAGCHQVLMGVETGNDEIARRMGKPIDKERYREAMRIARRHGLEVRATFIIGHLGETWETMMDTLNFAIELDVDLFQLNICTPYPGTELYRNVVADGKLTSMDWNTYGQGDVLFEQAQLSAADIYRFERYAFRKFYLRPRIVLRMLARITSPYHLRDYFRAAVHLLLGRRKKGRGDWQCWKDLREEAFLDLDLDEPQRPRLTHELRQAANFS
jgi:radical SAM superfamily enzyme YgiQ (UPF0313 family)